MSILFIPVVGTLVLGALWLRSEWRDRRWLRICLGFGFVGMVYLWAFTTANFFSYLEERKTRSCLLAVRAAIANGHAIQLEQLLSEYQSNSYSRVKGAQDRFCDGVDKLRPSDATQPKSVPSQN